MADFYFITSFEYYLKREQVSLSTIIVINEKVAESDAIMKTLA